MGNGESTIGGVYDEGLTVDFFRCGTGGVSGVANAEVSLELSHCFIVEDVVYHAHSLVYVEVLGAFPLACHNASRLLTSKDYRPVRIFEVIVMNTRFFLL